MVKVLGGTSLPDGVFPFSRAQLLQTRHREEGSSRLTGQRERRKRVGCPQGSDHSGGWWNQGGERGRCRQKGLQGEGQVGGPWMRLKNCRGWHLSDPLEDQRLVGGGLHCGFRCGPMEERGALSVSSPSLWDSSPLSISVVLQEFSPRGRVIPTVTQVLCPPLHPANRHLLSHF